MALAAQPVSTSIGDKTFLEAFAVTTGDNPISVLLRCSADTAMAESFASQQANSCLLAVGDLTLDKDGNMPAVFARSICEATADQYLNEVTIVGRASGGAKVAEKSVSRSLAVNRYVGKEEVTDWFKVRGFGFAKDKLENAPKGALLCISGCLTQMTNKEGQTYPELKARVIRVHDRNSGGGKGGHDQARGTKASGYSQQDFETDTMPFEWM